MTDDQLIALMVFLARRTETLDHVSRARALAEWIDDARAVLSMVRHSSHGALAPCSVCAGNGGSFGLPCSNCGRDRREK